MNRFRRFFAVCLFALLPTLPALSQSQHDEQDQQDHKQQKDHKDKYVGATSVVASGSMSVQLDSTITQAWTAQGFTHFFAFYNQTTLGYPGFYADSGTFNDATGEGDVQCQGFFYLSSGSLVMELRNWSLQTIGATPYLSAEVILNKKQMGRTIIMTAGAPVAFSKLPLQPGINRSAKAAFNFNPAFVTMFADFFQAPQLIPVMSPAATPLGAASVGVAVDMAALPTL